MERDDEKQQQPAPYFTTKVWCTPIEEEVLVRNSLSWVFLVLLCTHQINLALRFAFQIFRKLEYIFGTFLASFLAAFYLFVALKKEYLLSGNRFIVFLKLLPILILSMLESFVLYRLELDIIQMLFGIIAFFMMVLWKRSRPFRMVPRATL